MKCKCCVFLTILFEQTLLYPMITKCISPGAIWEYIPDVLNVKSIFVIYNTTNILELFITILSFCIINIHIIEHNSIVTEANCLELFL